MKTFLLVISGCHDETRFEVSLSIEQLNLLLLISKASEENGKFGGCSPALRIFEEYSKDDSSSAYITYNYDEEKYLGKVEGLAND